MHHPEEESSILMLFKFIVISNVLLLSEAESYLLAVKMKQILPLLILFLPIPFRRPFTIIVIIESSAANGGPAPI